MEGESTVIETKKIFPSCPVFLDGWWSRIIGGERLSGRKLSFDHVMAKSSSPSSPSSSWTPARIQLLYTQPTYTTDYQERLEAWANWAWSLGLYRSLVLFSTEPYDDDWDKFND
ncbi:hypothetical protein TNCV_70821 [Trichonephila clavipes]|nr:hypothetical protein TNCV_70821 [Trichonephila clavipes]